MSDDKSYREAMEIQRRNFEAQFGSIETLGYEDKSKQIIQDSDNSITSDSDSEQSGDEDQRVRFSGFSSGSESESESEDEKYTDVKLKKKQVPSVKPIVVKLNSVASGNKELTKEEKKMLRLGKIPTLSETKKQQTLNSLKINKNPTNHEDQDNLVNDLELQRLLKESHILAQSMEHSGADLTLNTLDHEAPIGKARKRTMDLRIRNIAEINSKTGGLPKKLEKMPMGMRKGMIESRTKKVAKYEQDARDAGIILSKVKKGELRDLKAGVGSTAASDRIGTGIKKDVRLRDRGLKINTIGRNTRNGLFISKHDIDRLTSKPKIRKGGKPDKRR